MIWHLPITGGRGILPENLNYACEQQRRRPGYAFMQSDPRRCYSPITKYIKS